MSVQPVTATIVDFDARGSGWDSHIVFIVSVSTAGGSCWTVERRSERATKPCIILSSDPSVF
jgi:hypothetical protein